MTSEFNTDYPGFTESDFIDGPPGNPFPNTGYAIIGVYQNGDVNGMTASSPDDSQIVNGETWESTLGHNYGQHSEQSIADTFASGSTFWVYNSYNFYTKVPFNTQAVLINYSEAAFAGTALATVVPEPASWMLLLTGAGVAFSGARRRHG